MNIGSPDNPWKAKLEASPLHRALDEKALKLFEPVSGDPDEHTLTSIACAHGLANRGFLVLTTHWLHWLQKFPKRHEFWPLDLALSYEGSLGNKILVLATGDQFQPTTAFTGGRLKQFYEYYGIVQRAISWEANQPTESIVLAAEPDEPITDTIGRLAWRHSATRT